MRVIIYIKRMSENWKVGKTDQIQVLCITATETMCKIKRGFVELSAHAGRPTGIRQGHACSQSHAQSQVQGIFTKFWPISVKWMTTQSRAYFYQLLSQTMGQRDWTSHTSKGYSTVLVVILSIM